MRDLDMSDDLVKVVRWRILWTEPDNEQEVDHGTDIVNYRTSADQYGGQIIANFVRVGLTERTSEQAAALQRLNVSPRTQRYMKVFLEVIQRYPKEEAQYDRRRTEALEGLERHLRVLG